MARRLFKSHSPPGTARRRKKHPPAGRRARAGSVRIGAYASRKPSSRPSGSGAERSQWLTISTGRPVSHPASIQACSRWLAGTAAVLLPGAHKKTGIGQRSVRSPLRNRNVAYSAFGASASTAGTAAFTSSAFLAGLTGLAAASSLTSWRRHISAASPRRTPSLRIRV